MLSRPAPRSAPARGAAGIPLSSASNPPLRYGDVVVVNRNQLSKVTDGLEDAFQPLNPILNVSSIFRLLGLPMSGLLGL